MGRPLGEGGCYGGWCGARIRPSRIGLEAERVHRGYGGDPVLAFIGILLFIVGFNFDYGSLVWIYASESFPTRLRTQGGSAMLTSDLFANFIVGVVFLNALGALGGSLTFGIFMILALLSLIFIYRLAPETKGRQLESIRRYWYNGGRWPEEAEIRA